MCRPTSHTDPEIAGLTAASPTGPNEITHHNVSLHFCARAPRPAVAAPTMVSQRPKGVRSAVNLLR